MMAEMAPLYTFQPIEIHAQPLFAHVCFELHLDKHGSRHHLTLLHDSLTEFGVADLDPSFERWPMCRRRSRMTIPVKPVATLPLVWDDLPDHSFHGTILRGGESVCWDEPPLFSFCLYDHARCQGLC